MIEELINLGFSDKEARIYFLLCQFGELSAPKIAKELNMHRRTVYDLLDNLFNKGFISKKQINNKEVFSAVDSNIIAKEFYYKYISFKKAASNIKPKKSNLSINVLKGNIAVKIIVENALKFKDEMLMLGRGGYTIEQLGDAIYQYIPRTKQLNWRMLQTVDYKKYKIDFAPKELRFLPQNMSFETGFLTFKDRVYLFSNDSDLVVIEITNLAFANTFRNYFEIIWQLSGK